MISKKNNKKKHGSPPPLVLSAVEEDDIVMFLKNDLVEDELSEEDNDTLIKVWRVLCQCVG